MTNTEHRPIELSINPPDCVAEQCDHAIGQHPTGMTIACEACTFAGVDVGTVDVVAPPAVAVRAQQAGQSQPVNRDRRRLPVDAAEGAGPLSSIEIPAPPSITIEVFERRDGSDYALTVGANLIAVPTAGQRIAFKDGSVYEVIEVTWWPEYEWTVEVVTTKVQDKR